MSWAENTRMTRCIFCHVKVQHPGIRFLLRTHAADRAAALSHSHLSLVLKHLFWTSTPANASHPKMFFRFSFSTSFLSLFSSSSSLSVLVRNSGCLEHVPFTPPSLSSRTAIALSHVHVSMCPCGRSRFIHFGCVNLGVYVNKPWGTRKVRLWLCNSN
ncbi:uncharacterized protein EI90DRAFT_3057881 [Cantharellus anzutake]|uniref:uncharacterized protein n=1 Tax=Cantharellus anzutake TaxID=1750568 RepID=UPI0019036D04|nr:uncharacterized protein EI90DRAFT_3057881 [Cantharellus anzutake]KAF8331419.1 hypothetical protein EI90DRAFT_3057881 [Cantharellus anzutake]